MVLVVGWGGAAGTRIIKNLEHLMDLNGFGGGVGRLAQESLKIHRILLICMVLEVGVRGAVGTRVIENPWNLMDLHGFGGGGGWHQNH